MEPLEQSTATDAMQLQLEVWREACRHIELQTLLERLLPVLSRYLPVVTIMVRRWNSDRARLDTLTVSGRDVSALNATPIELDARASAELAAMFSEGQAFIAAFDARSPTFGQPHDSAGNSIVLLLSAEDGTQGILSLFADDGEVTIHHRTLAQTLVEPFSIALANDRRVHELARLREAVLAENRALLLRLQRQSVVESIIGEDGGLKSLMQRVTQVATTDVPVLILGETGSGKEVIARAIHERSRRSTGPIVRVNCGAIPTELVDSELFGHERGAFTGALATRKGWFERADGGTLFLDEIGELPLAAQVRLLRVLQEGALERVGGQRTIAVDVRIVAATHRDLHDMVVQRTFREDLWYRLSVFPLLLPALRDRVEDIPALAEHFAGRAGERLSGKRLVPTTSDLDLLRSYHWPGNVRELAAVLERAAILGHGKRLEIAASLGGTPRSESSRPSTPSAPLSLDTPKDSTNLDDVTRSHIAAVLKMTWGRVEGPQGAAALLGINANTLRSRMRKLGINWSKYRGYEEGA